jgi:hypothetical protein
LCDTNIAKFGAVDLGAGPGFEGLRQRFPGRDQPYLRRLLGRPPGIPADRVLRLFLGISGEIERKTLIHSRLLPAPATLPTEDPSVDDEWMNAVLRVRLQEPRREAAWHLRGNIRIARWRPWIVANGRLLLDATADYESVPAVPVWPHYFKTLYRKPARRLPRALLLRHSSDGNYWHLLNDVMPRVPMAEAIGIDKTVPVVVSERFRRRFLQQLNDLDFFRGRPVVVQSEDEIFQCDELFVLQPAEFAPDWTAAMVARIPAAPVAGAPAGRLYCRRVAATATGRIAENSAEIEQLFRSAGFSIVDSAAMNIPEQKAAFQHAEIVAGINGAAFANALFRQGRPLTIGALISSNLLSSAVPTFAKAFGFRFVGHLVPAAGADRASPIVIPRETALRLIDRLTRHPPA